MGICVVEFDIFKHSRVIGFDVVFDLVEHIPSFILTDGTEFVVAFGRDADYPCEFGDDFFVIGW